MRRIGVVGLGIVGVQWASVFIEVFPFNLMINKSLGRYPFLA